MISCLGDRRQDREAPARTAVGLRSIWLDVAAVVAFAALAGFLRSPPLGQSSLWLDDAWAALAYKTDGLRELGSVALTSPGFAALLKGWLAVVGFSSTKAQLLPFLIGTATPPVLYGALRRRRISASGAAAGALLLTFSEFHIVYSSRVKQYTLDALVTVALVVAFWRLVEEPTERRWWWTAAAVAVVGVLLSTPTVTIAASGLVAAWAVIAVRRWFTLHAVAATAAVGAFFAAWFALVVIPAVNPALREFFAGSYIDLSDGASTALADAFDAISAVVEGAVPLPQALALALAAVALVVTLWRRPAIGLVLALPFAFAVVAAALERAPLGTGRTDIYLYPLLAVAVAVALHALAESRVPIAGPTALVALAAAIVLLPNDSPDRSYPQEDIAPLVERLEVSVSASDAVLVYPLANFAFGLYTTWPIEFRETSLYGTGFEVDVHRPNVFVLDNHRSEPRAYAESVERIRTRYTTVWYIASHTASDSRVIRGQLRRLGYRPVLVLKRPGALLVRYSLARR
jgi:hypothetical protein